MVVIQSPTMSFVDKVVIVTGASSGIGAATAVLFAQQSANVVIVGRNDVKLSKVAETCQKAKGKKPLKIVADVSNDNDAKRIIKDTVTHFGKINVLVNNAGIGGLTNILDEKFMEVNDRIMATNLRAVVLLTHLAAKYLIETKGSIVNISSIASTLVSIGSPYNTSKAGLDHFSRCVAAELAGKGVRVNVINPGPVKTDIAINMGLTDDLWSKLEHMTALKRVSDPEEIGELVLYLASEKAKGITGSCFVSDCGMLVTPSGASNAIQE